MCLNFFFSDSKMAKKIGTEHDDTPVDSALQFSDKPNLRTRKTGLNRTVHAMYETRANWAFGLTCSTLPNVDLFVDNREHTHSTWMVT